MLVIICAKYWKNPSGTEMLKSGHDFQGQGQMTLKIYVKVKGHNMQHTPLH